MSLLSGTMGRLFLLCLTLISVFLAPALASQSYVVYMGAPLQSSLQVTRTNQHYVMLSSVMGSELAAEEAMLYIYKNFNAFATKLTPEQAALLAEREDVVSVVPNKKYQLHTTRSWEFLGLEDAFGNVADDSLWKKSNYGEDVVIGLLDSGVWPESKSFSDTGLGPIPASWKGKCETGDQFGPEYCNKKLIGGKYFLKGFEAEEGPLNTTETGDYRSARDSDGHGTHTASTAGGNFAPGANTLGLANGTAKGGAPHARIAAYKVCWPSIFGGGCYTSDILAAFDEGVEDGVNVFSVSLGSDPPLDPFFLDGLAIGSFHALQNGITTVASAGNAGPSPGSVSNVPPWMITVAASSIDRDFRAFVVLGDNVTVQGKSLTGEKLDEQKFYPLIDAASAPAPGVNASLSMFCLPGSLDEEKVKGKIVACLRGISARVDKSFQVKLAGGIGMILSNAKQNGNKLMADPHFLPSLMVTYEDGQKVYKYIEATKNPIATILPTKTVLGVKPAPVLSAFSSQGPNTLVIDINKPDITAPGEYILAAYTEARAITDLPGDNRKVKYNIISGTSMSCPHISGVSASLKSLHPNWSPAAIRSAIMTTASQKDNAEEAITEASAKVSTPFGVGSGFVNPNRAADPGLIYDISFTDYFNFFCALGYTKKNIKTITGQSFECPEDVPKVSNLNYPSITVSELAGSQEIMRTVTNVGSPSSIYKVSIISPPGVMVEISPPTLSFSALEEKKSFKVKITKVSDTKDYVFGTYTWSDGTYSVRSSIIVKTLAAS
ncbi:hypothetical protein R1flu_028913 [Riccia fluitans]|uniref:Subtilisin-like protease SBT5.3 n=1 Tax=Riccia fluitans TaxID=41844 RepID=A0ABD1XN10_9MARC